MHGLSEILLAGLVLLAVVWLSLRLYFWEKSRHLRQLIESSDTFKKQRKGDGLHELER